MKARFEDAIPAGKSACYLTLMFKNGHPEETYLSTFSESPGSLTHYLDVIPCVIHMTYGDDYQEAYDSMKEELEDLRRFYKGPAWALLASFSLEE